MSNIAIRHRSAARFLISPWRNPQTFSPQTGTPVIMTTGQAQWKNIQCDPPLACCGLFMQHINGHLAGLAFGLGFHPSEVQNSNLCLWYCIIYTNTSSFPPCIFICSLFVIFAQCLSFSLWLNTLLQGQDQKSGVMWLGCLIHTEMLPKLLGSKAWRLSLSHTHTHKLSLDVSRTWGFQL